MIDWLKLFVKKKRHSATLHCKLEVLEWEKSKITMWCLNFTEVKWHWPNDMLYIQHFLWRFNYNFVRRTISIVVQSTSEFYSIAIAYAMGLVKN